MLNISLPNRQSNFERVNDAPDELADDNIDHTIEEHPIEETSKHSKKKRKSEQKVEISSKEIQSAKRIKRNEKSLNKQSRLGKTSEEKHVKIKKVHECSVCMKVFGKPKDLTNHTRLVHTSERPFVCGQRGATFAISHLLLRHQRYHLGITNYSCDQCPKSFMQKNDLRKHMRTHTGEKPFKCDECKRSFARNDYLRKHKHLHFNINTVGEDLTKPSENMIVAIKSTIGLDESASVSEYQVLSNSSYLINTSSKNEPLFMKTVSDPSTSSSTFKIPQSTFTVPHSSIDSTTFHLLPNSR